MCHLYLQDFKVLDSPCGGNNGIHLSHHHWLTAVKLNLGLTHNWTLPEKYYHKGTSDFKQTHINTLAPSEDLTLYRQMIIIF